MGLQFRVTPLFFRHSTKNINHSENTMHLGSLRTLFLALSIGFCGASLAQKDEALLKAADGRKAGFVADLEKLVNIDSGTGDTQGLGRIEAFLVARLKAVGADVSLVPSEAPAVGNIIVATLKGKGTKKAMLMVHHDTVYPAGDAARRPFRIAGNKAFGPGVADAKPGLLFILNSLELLRERGFDRYSTITVSINADEEKSSLGSRALIRKLAADQDLVLSFEPPEQEQVIISTNGIAYVHLDVKGLASHAGSAPEKGRNAAIEMANQLLQLKDLGDPLKGTTVNWTVLQSGDRINVIPDQASAKADMRLSALSELDRVQQDANRISQKKLIAGTEVTVRVEDRRPPFSKNANTDALAIAAQAIYQDLGKTLEPVAMRFGTDAGFAFNPANPRQAVLEGMGIVGDKLHNPDEWADLDSIVPRLYLTVKLMENVLSGQ
jgi:glutamate carboxypeptidase